MAVPNNIKKTQASKTFEGSPKRMPRIRMFTALFTKIRTARTTFANKGKTYQQEQKRSNLYTDCSDFPLHNFIKVLTDREYKYLFRDGNVTLSEQECADHFDTIYLVYLDLIGNDEYGYLTRLSLEIQSLYSLQVAVSVAINQLRKRKDPRLVQILLEIGYDVKLMAGFDEYFRSIDRVEKHLKALAVEHERKLKEFGELKKNYDGRKIDLNYFDDILALLTKYYGVMFTAENTTVKQFAAHLRKYNKDMEREKDKWHKGQK